MVEPRAQQNVSLPRKAVYFCENMSLNTFLGTRWSENKVVLNFEDGAMKKLFKQKKYIIDTSDKMFLSYVM